MYTLGRWWLFQAHSPIERHEGKRRRLYSDMFCICWYRRPGTSVDISSRFFNGLFECRICTSSPSECRYRTGMSFILRNYISLKRCVERMFWVIYPFFFRVCGVILNVFVLNLIERNPSPQGGFLFDMFPDQEPSKRGPFLKNHPQN